jgi:hypothetical protein
VLAVFIIALMMEAAITSETQVNLYWILWRSSPENSRLLTFLCSGIMKY